MRKAANTRGLRRLRVQLVGITAPASRGRAPLSPQHMWLGSSESPLPACAGWLGLRDRHGAPVLPGAAGGDSAHSWHCHSLRPSRDLGNSCRVRGQGRQRGPGSSAPWDRHCRAGQEHVQRRWHHRLLAVSLYRQLSARALRKGQKAARQPHGRCRIGTVCGGPWVPPRAGPIRQHTASTRGRGSPELSQPAPRHGDFPRAALKPLRNWLNLTLRAGAPASPHPTPAPGFNCSGC